MKSGQLRQRVVIQYDSGDSLGSRGQKVVNWQTFATVWARVEPLSGLEQPQGHQMDLSINHRVTIRYLAGVTPRMRVLFGARKFNIVSVLNSDERNVSMSLLCTEDV